MFSLTKRRTNPVKQNDDQIDRPFSMMNFRLNRPSAPPLALPPPPRVNDTGKKMIWGEPTWFFLHTIAHKVKPETFFIVKRDLLRYVYAICTNLPCPFCASHAKTYLDSVNFNAIQSRDELRMLIFTFHNVVNSRKGYTIFKLEDLDAKYSTAITLNMFNNFIKHFSDKNRAPGLIADDMFRAKLCMDITSWFRTNYQFFEG
jgi:hypothetical protein